MQPTLCSKCKKNVAVVFISRMNEKGEPVNEGLCLKCAAQLGLPQVEDMMKRMGITPEDLENINSEMMQAFGGAGHRTHDLVEVDRLAGAIALGHPHRGRGRWRGQVEGRRGGRGRDGVEHMVHWRLHA